MPPRTEDESPASKAFASRLAKFGYADQSGPSRPSRSQSVSTTPSKATKAEGDTSSSPIESSKTRKRGSASHPDTKDDVDSTPTKKVKKVPRPYADPGVYAHLQNTPDHLAIGLDSASPTYFSDSALTGTDRGSHFLRHQVCVKPDPNVPWGSC